jgi:hypothetical protein
VGERDRACYGLSAVLIRGLREERGRGKGGVLYIKYIDLLMY